MRYSVNYPNTYNSDKLLEHQSAVPSQWYPMGTPYSPDQMIDVPSPTPTPPPNSVNYVEYVYDTRPANEQDFCISYSTSTDVPIGFFLVPVGYIGVLRGVSIMGFVDPAVGNTTHCMNIAGNNVNVGVVEASLNVDGQTALGFGAIPIEKAVFGRVDIECFILANEGQQFGVHFEILNGDPPANVLWNVVLSGQYLLATGRTLSLECTNAMPAPVVIESSDLGV